MEKIDKDICPVCGFYLVEHMNSDLRLCLNCSYDEHYEEVKMEVLYIIEYALKRVADESYDDVFCVPNGSMWRYSEILDFLEKNINAK